MNERIKFQNNLKKIISDHWPLIFSFIVLVVLILTIYCISLSQNDGFLVYALDDAYIHMSIAKNFALHNVWGVTKYGYTSSTSSILWTFLLSLIYKTFGVILSAPLILNIVLSFILLYLVYFLLKKKILTSYLSNHINFYSCTCLIFIIFITPLPALIFSGQEHILQVIIWVLFLYISSKLLSMDSFDKDIAKQLLFISPFVTTIRYEGLFLIFVVGLLLILKKRFLFCFILVSVSLIPLILYGLTACNHGWLLLPNSVIVKSPFYFMKFNEVIQYFIGLKFYHKLTQEPCLLISIFFFFFVLINNQIRGQEEKKEHLMLKIFIFVALLQVIFGQIGWFYRYEAYLIVWSIFLAMTFLANFFSIYIKNSIFRSSLTVWLIFLIIFSGLPFMKRGLSALIETTQVMNDRFIEHIGMSRFVSQYYNNSTLMVNDIGTVSFFSEAKILDFYALASMEPVVKQLLNNKQDLEKIKKEINEWAIKEKTKIGILQTGYLRLAERIPKEWILVGYWKIPRNILFNDRIIAFYAIDPSEKETLINNLKHFICNGMSKKIILTLFE